MRVNAFSALAELNLSFLYFMREALIRDRLQALADFDIDPAVADLLLSLTADQMIRLAHSEVLLVGLRWRRGQVWSCLGDYAAGADAALPRALIAAESLADGYQA